MPTCRIRRAFGSATTSSCRGWVRWTRLPAGAISARSPSRSGRPLRNMAHMLESAGAGLDRILKMTVVLADAADYDEMNRVWGEFFPTDPPARTTCALQLSNGNGVEIECIALAGQSPS